MDLLRKSGVNLEHGLCSTPYLEGSFPLEGEQAVRPYTRAYLAFSTLTFAGDLMIRAEEVPPLQLEYLER